MALDSKMVWILDSAETGFFYVILTKKEREFCDNDSGSMIVISISKKAYKLDRLLTVKRTIINHVSQTLNPTNGNVYEDYLSKLRYVLQAVTHIYRSRSLLAYVRNHLASVYIESPTLLPNSHKTIMYTPIFYVILIEHL